MEDEKPIIEYAKPRTRNAKRNELLFRSQFVVVGIIIIGRGFYIFYLLRNQYYPNANQMFRDGIINVGIGSLIIWASTNHFQRLIGRMVSKRK